MDVSFDKKRDFVEAPVVAALIRRPNGKIFLVRRGDTWTLLTGKFEWGKEEELRETLLRELGEEAFGLKEEELGLIGLREVVKEHLISIWLIDTIPLDYKNDDTGGKRAVMTIYFCEVAEGSADIMRHEEGADFCWVDSSREIIDAETVGEPSLPLDRLARKAMGFYLEKFPLLANRRKVVRMVEWLRQGFQIFFDKKRLTK